MLDIAFFSDTGSSDITVWLKGYLYPRVNSTYEFTLVTNGNAALFISTDATRGNRQPIASNSATKGSANLIADT